MDAIDVMPGELDCQQALRACGIDFESLVGRALLNAPVSILIADARKTIRFVNQHFCRRTGHRPEDVVGRPVGILKSGLTADRTYDSLRRSLEAGETWIGEFRNRTISGATYWDAAIIQPVRDPFGRTAWYVSVQVAITEAKAARPATVLGRRRPQLRNSMKPANLRWLGHELRTPLNAIIGFSQMLLEQSADTGAQFGRSYLKHILDSSHFMLGLVNDTLDMARIEAGQYPLHEEVFDLGTVIQASVDLLHPAVSDGHLVIDARVADPALRVLADPRAIQQILLNLLSNAVKFTPAGGRIAVRAMREPDGALALAVSDTGIGMTDSESAAAMKEFTQIDNPYTRRCRGSGLGLPLCRSLAELHGGSLAIASAPDAGTTVTVRIPADRVVSSGQV